MPCQATFVEFGYDIRLKGLAFEGEIRKPKTSKGKQVSTHNTNSSQHMTELSKANTTNSHTKINKQPNESRTLTTHKEEQQQRRKHLKAKHINTKRSEYAKQEQTPRSCFPNTSNNKTIEWRLETRWPKHLDYNDLKNAQYRKNIPSIHGLPTKTNASNKEMQKTKTSNARKHIKPRKQTKNKRIVSPRKSKKQTQRQIKFKTTHNPKHQE